MFAEGAAIVDIGGESTRPGAGGNHLHAAGDRSRPARHRRHPPRTTRRSALHRQLSRSYSPSGHPGRHGDCQRRKRSSLGWRHGRHLRGPPMRRHPDACTRTPRGLEIPARLLPEEVVPLVREELAQRRSAALAAGIAPQCIVSIPASASAKYTMRTIRFCWDSPRSPRSASPCWQASPAKASSAARSPRCTARAALPSLRATCDARRHHHRHPHGSVAGTRPSGPAGSGSSPHRGRNAGRPMTASACCPEEGGWLRS